MEPRPTLEACLDTACDVALYRSDVASATLCRDIERVADSLSLLAAAGEAATTDSAVWTELKAQACRLRQRSGAKRLR